MGIPFALTPLVDRIPVWVFASVLFAATISALRGYSMGLRMVDGHLLIRNYCRTLLVPLGSVMGAKFAKDGSSGGARPLRVITRDGADLKVGGVSTWSPRFNDLPGGEMRAVLRARERVNAFFGQLGFAVPFVDVDD